MKKMVIFASLLLFGCFTTINASAQKSRSSSNNTADAALYDTDWKLVSLDGELVDTAGLKARPFLHFSKKDKRVHGNGGCNTMGGAFTATGDKLHFSPLISSKMACPGLVIENKFFKALSQVTSYDLSEDRLELIGENGSLAILSTR